MDPILIPKSVIFSWDYLQYELMCAALALMQHLTCKVTTNHSYHIHVEEL